MTLVPVPRAAAQADPKRCVGAHADAQLLQRRGSLMAAREQLLVCAQQGCPKPIAADCGGWLSEVEQSLPSLVLAVSDETGADLLDVHVTANGAPMADKIDGRALTLDPGRYQLQFEADGYDRVTQSITVRQSEKNRIVRVQLHHQLASPSPSPSPSPVPQTESKSIPAASYVFSGAAVLGLGMFTYFGLSELSEVKEKERLDQANAQRRQMSQPEQPCGSLCERGKRDFILTYVGLGVTVAAATGAVLAYVLSEPEHAARTRLDLVPTRQGALLRVQGQF